MKQIICVKWGSRYGADYVNKLYAMAARHISGPFRLYCLTDNPVGIRPEVHCRDLPPLGVDIPEGVPGKWPKVVLWGETLHDIQGVVLFIDLDTVITGSLDEFFSYGKPEDVILARNWIKPLERLGQTSIFRFKVGSQPYILSDFRADPARIATQYQFEQRYITNCIRGGVTFWPSRWVSHFRLNCLGPWPMRYLRTPRLPRQTRVVIFPGKPDPVDAALGRWGETAPRLPAWAHIRHALKAPAGKRYRLLKRYCPPTPWVERHWRE